MSGGTLMSVLQKLKNLFDESNSVQFRYYECRECGNEFRSAKIPERAQCPECLSNDLDLTDEA